MANDYTKGRIKLKFKTGDIIINKNPYQEERSYKVVSFDQYGYRCNGLDGAGKWSDNHVHFFFEPAHDFYEIMEKEAPKKTVDDVLLELDKKIAKCEAKTIQCGETLNMLFNGEKYGKIAAYKVAKEIISKYLKETEPEKLYVTYTSEDGSVLQI